jgi:hypothetical protein
MKGIRRPQTQERTVFSFDDLSSERKYEAVLL